mmetsp:Transcript_42479/g.68286  ORF Transcript_42479/g.68286 Transcript_42479/m.68286 type:complete len:294 (+) Transcript_42479:857-1738(+)
MKEKEDAQDRQDTSRCSGSMRCESTPFPVSRNPSLPSVLAATLIPLPRTPSSSSRGHCHRTASDLGPRLITAGSATAWASPAPAAPGHTACPAGTAAASLGSSRAFRKARGRARLRRAARTAAAAETAARTAAAGTSFAAAGTDTAVAEAGGRRLPPARRPARSPAPPHPGRTPRPAPEQSLESCPEWEPAAAPSRASGTPGSRTGTGPRRQGGGPACPGTRLLLHPPAAAPASWRCGRRQRRRRRQQRRHWCSARCQTSVSRRPAPGTSARAPARWSGSRTWTATRADDAPQ